MSDTPDDDFLEAEVESALAPCRAMGLSVPLLEEMANNLRIALTSHPTGRFLMRRARPAEGGSGSVPTEVVIDAVKARSAR